MRASETLNDNEQMVLGLRPHKVFLVPGFVAVVVALAAAFVWTRVGLEDEANRVSSYAVIAAVVAAFGFLGWVWLSWSYTRFHLTSQRVLIWQGVLSRRRVEIPLDRINTVFVEQTLFERIMRCGELSIESAGEGGRETFPQCPSPLDVKHSIHRQKNDRSERHQNGNEDISRAAPAQAGSDLSDADLAGQLERLVALRDSGILDVWEFDEAKAKVLSRYNAG